MKKTTLYNVHEKLGAKLIDFAGYMMPVQYSSIIAEHKAVRNSVGVFDVSHMGEIFVKGAEALDFVQYITINDASKLCIGRVQYSAMCYEDGGIADDILIYKMAEDEFMLVVNASNKDKDFDWMKQNNKFNAELTDKSDEYTLLAVQGPKSRETLQKICNRELNLEYYHFFEGQIAGVDAIISRTGYTGESGYEIYFKGDTSTAELLWHSLFEAGKEFNIRPVGLGARDSLRLEMGFCLYGHEIDHTTNPLEAGLAWITRLNKEEYIGKDALLKIKAGGLKRKLIAMISEEKAFPRQGYDLTVGGRKVGYVTSGTVSPTFGKAIAMGYVDSEYISDEGVVNFMIRGKEIPAKLIKSPFIRKQ
ncbi:MAG: glycine cleavage system aminomethyltransferase GcvT [Ignavibacteria bacterium]